MTKDKTQGGIWTPQQNRRCLATIADTVKAYSLLLEICYPSHNKSFRDRLENNPHAAQAEAVVFSWLRSQQMAPTLADAPGVGGPDYLCSPPSAEPFLIEVTSLKKDAVEKRSGWPDELTQQAESFGMITPNLWSKTRAKARQLGDRDVARVLAICLRHIGAGALLGNLAAEWFMTSEPRISAPLSAPLNPAKQVTDLGKAAFLDFRDGAVTPVRQSISAILLVATWKNQLEVLGMLHPQPAVAFDYRTFREVHFLRLEWPVMKKTLHTEWVVANPRPSRFPHVAVSPSNEELRGE